MKTLEYPFSAVADDAYPLASGTDRQNPTRNRVPESMPDSVYLQCHVKVFLSYYGISPNRMSFGLCITSLPPDSSVVRRLFQANILYLFATACYCLPFSYLSFRANEGYRQLNPEDVSGIELLNISGNISNMD